MMEPSPYRPEVSALPELADGGVSNIRQQGLYATRKPPISQASSDTLTFGPSAQSIAAEEYANDMAAAFAVSKSYDRRNRAVAKARARQNDRALKRSNPQGNRTRRKLQGTTNRRSDSYILRNARDVLGMGTDLYR